MMAAGGPVERPKARAKRDDWIAYADHLEGRPTAAVPTRTETQLRGKIAELETAADQKRRDVSHLKRELNTLRSS